jgi:transcriptional regulator with XRE-family HTH domain
MAIRHRALSLLGENIRTFRSAQNLTQETLAEKSELDSTYISGIERGVRNPSVLSLIRIAKALNISASDLLEGVKV